MKMIIGIFIGLIIGVFTSAAFVVSSDTVAYKDGFKDGRDYGAIEATQDGQIIATYKDEITVGYANGDMAQYARIKDK